MLSRPRHVGDVMLSRHVGHVMFEQTCWTCHVEWLCSHVIISRHVYVLIC